MVGCNVATCNNWWYYTWINTWVNIWNNTCIKCCNNTWFNLLLNGWINTWINCWYRRCGDSGIAAKYDNMIIYHFLYYYHFLLFSFHHCFDSVGVVFDELVIVLVVDLIRYIIIVWPIGGYHHLFFSLLMHVRFVSICFDSDPFDSILKCMSDWAIPQTLFFLFFLSVSFFLSICAIVAIVFDVLWRHAALI